VTDRSKTPAGRRVIPLNDDALAPLVHPLLLEMTRIDQLGAPWRFPQDALRRISSHSDYQNSAVSSSWGSW
jgi:hypothetical protein